LSILALLLSTNAFISMQIITISIVNKCGGYLYKLNLGLDLPYDKVSVLI